MKVRVKTKTTDSFMLMNKLIIRHFTLVASLKTTITVTVKRNDQTRIYQSIRVITQRRSVTLYLSQYTEQTAVNHVIISPPDNQLFCFH